MAIRFAASGIATAEIDARLLLCAAAGIDHAGFVRDPHALLGPQEAGRLGAFEARRLAHEPVSRILGRREFWGLTFALSASVLDPRPETEGLVASVLDALGMRREVPLRILDLGTGSGAIVAALLYELPQAWGAGVDKSFEAAQVARANLDHLGLGTRSAVICGDWTEPLGARFDVVVSNPPYVAAEAMATLEPDVRDYDPEMALDGGADGLDAYRILVPSLTELLAPHGVAAFECGTGQGEAVASLMRQAGMTAPSVYRDLAGHDRVVLGVASA